MVFSGLTFLFFFLPAVLLVYYISTPKIRNFVLLAASLVFYAWGEPKYILIMLFSAVFNYVGGLIVGNFQKKTAKSAAVAFLVISVAVNLTLLGVFKYAGGYFGLPLPIGISFYTFQTMSYVIDVYRGGVKPQRNFINFAAYVTMFPQLIAGPIVRYKTVEDQLEHRTVSVEKFAAGIRRFITGLAKKVLLANIAGQLWDYALGTAADERTVVLSWLGAAAFTFQIYFDFSGYSDMAIGLGRMFGFEYDENFKCPYMQRSITGFWRTWHISLGTWFKEYVYIPLGGNRKGFPRQIINIMIVWALTGIWHGASMNFLVWGIYFGILLIMEKLFLSKILDKIPKIFGHIYMMVAVMLGWVIFAAEDFGVMGGYLASMFGAGAGFVSDAALYQLIKYALFMVIFIVGCTDYPAKAAAGISKRLKKPVAAVMSNVFYASIMLASVALIVSDSYNPFLYFRF